MQSPPFYFLPLASLLYFLYHFVSCTLRISFLFRRVYGTDPDKNQQKNFPPCGGRNSLRHVYDAKMVCALTITTQEKKRWNKNLILHQVLCRCPNSTFMFTDWHSTKISNVYPQMKFFRSIHAFSHFSLLDRKMNMKFQDVTHVHNQTNYFFLEKMTMPKNEKMVYESDMGRLRCDRKWG